MKAFLGEAIRCAIPRTEHLAVLSSQQEISSRAEPSRFPPHICHGRKRIRGHRASCQHPLPPLCLNKGSDEERHFARLWLTGSALICHSRSGNNILRVEPERV